MTMATSSSCSPPSAPSSASSESRQTAIGIGQLVFDIEADGLLLDATRVWCICAKDLDSGVRYRWGPNKLVEGYATLLTAKTLIAHNGRMYDQPTLYRLVGKPNNLPPLKPCFDTILMSRLTYSDIHSNPVEGHALEDWGRFLKCPKGGHSDWSQFSQEMLDYCAQDVEVTAKVYQYLLPKVLKTPKAAKLEHDVGSIIVRQIVNGVTLNRDHVDDLQKKLTVKLSEIRQKLDEMFPPKVIEVSNPEYWESETGQRYTTKKAAQSAGHRKVVRGPNRKKIIPFNPDSSKQVLEVLTAKGWVPPMKRNKKTGVESPTTDTKALESCELPEAEVIKDHRLVGKKYSQTEEWLAAVRPDGRIHGDVTTNGAVTGRMSHSKPNVNVPKVKKPWGKECRQCFGPRPGWFQVGADASGLELRMLAHYLAPMDGGRYAGIVSDKTQDVHEVHRVILEIESRDDAKTFIYAYLFGGGDPKIGSIVLPSGSLSARKRRGAELRKIFETRLTGLDKLIAEISWQVKTENRLIGLDGRYLPVRSAHAALNTLLQSAGAVVMKKALVILDARLTAEIGPPGQDWEFMLNVHDEWQLESRTEELAHKIGQMAVESIALAGVQLGVRCPLAGEYKVGRNWAECH